MAGPEARLRTAIVKRLRAYSGFWVVIPQSMYTSQIGLPDIVGCYAGKFIGLEVKRPGRLHTLTARQSAVLERVRREGGRSAVVTSVNEAIDFVFNDPPL